MISCPNCGAPLREGERFCIRCGAPVRSTRTRSINISLSRRDARRGCTRLLRYPGAPAPIKVRLPRNVRSGAQLYLNDVPFLTGEGDTVQGALRICISVKKRRVLPFLLALLVLLSAGAAAYFRLPELSLPIPERLAAIFETTESEPTPLVLPTHPPEPTPTPYVSPLRPLQQEAAALIPNFELRYFLMELDDRLLENFIALYTAVAEFQPECSFPQQLSRQELANLMLLLSYECPELLQFSAATEMSYLVDDEGRVLSVMPELCLSREERNEQYRLCAKAATELAMSVQGLSQTEKELAAYNYITSHCFYDFDAPYSASAYGALVAGRAKCDGISLAMKWLCEEMGISCMVISGTESADQVGHAWNIICIDGTYYDLDVTNDVPSEDRNIPYYGAFNVSRHWIRDRYTQHVSFSGFMILPGSESMSMSHHARSGSFVSSGEDYEARFFSLLDNTADGDAVYIQFESEAQYWEFIGGINELMGRWEGGARGSFNYALSHLDEFQVCRVLVSFI